MRKAAVLMGAVALIVGATNLSAQGKNLAGTWTVVIQAGYSAGTYPNATATMVFTAM